MRKSSEWDKREKDREHQLEIHKPQICLGKGGDILIIDISMAKGKERFFISVGRLIISSTSGIWIHKPLIQTKVMTALLRFFDLCELDRMAGNCQKCIHYPINFHNSIREGNEIQYSGYYHRTIPDIILGRNKV